ncbi:MAG: family 16 glycosylhydrolase [candidate division WS1 bacterium]|nr:family 16 glycosylhydrolase [candidate division WS1 bacterium]
MKINWLLQGSFLFESGGYRLLVDPYISTIVEDQQGATRLAPPPLTAEELAPDAIYLTHDHLDHLDPVGLPEILHHHPAARVYGPVSIQRKFEELGFDTAPLQVLAVGDRLTLGPFRLTVLPALHSDADATGLLLEVEGLLIYLSGDSEFSEDLPAQVLEACGGQPPDYALLCINGRWGNMSAEEAVRVAQTLQVTTAIPMHYGLFVENTADPEPFVKACQEAGLQARTLPPGEWVDFPAHVASLLPAGKQWKLVWRDEFDGDTLDPSKWGFRLHMMQQRHHTFSEEGAGLDGQGNLLLTLHEKDGQFYSPHLQTGSNFLDRPGPSYGKFHWPIAPIEVPRFVHKYGYYEIRCKLPTQPGWWAAFWLQSPTIGATLDPAQSGVEVDIMENFTRDGIVSHNNHWNGYGGTTQSLGSGERQLEETPDGFHVFGLDWSPEAYVYYIDGQESWRVEAPISHCEQFILVSTECMGYRAGDSPDPLLLEAVLPDYFIVDYVRVFDEVR